jgi:glutathione S-transferase
LLGSAAWSATSVGERSITISVRTSTEIDAHLGADDRSVSSDEPPVDERARVVPWRRMRLHVMSYSPWSERARFALLHHRISFEEREHVPLLGELALRARARGLGRPATVPLLVDGQTRVMGSLPIAHHADTVGGGDRLIEPTRLDAITALNDELEPMMHAIRARLLELASEHDDVAIGLTPPALRSLPLSAASARLAGKYIAAKHRASLADVTARLRAGLGIIRARLAGRPYVFECFSYADVVCATPLAIVKPVDDAYVPLHPGLRQHIVDEGLAAEFEDLSRWRDELYDRHRPRRD